MTTNNSFSGYSLIKLLKTFSKNELNEFKNLVSSPFYNNHSTLIKIISVLSEFHPRYNNQKLTKEYLYNAVNKGRPFDDIVFRKYLSRLFKLAEEYLNILEFRKKKTSKEINILNQYSKRNIPDLYSKKSTEIDKEIVIKDNMETDFFLNLHFLNEVRFFESINNFDIRNEHFHLEQSLINLTTFYIFESGLILNQMSSYKKYYNLISNLKLESYFFKTSNIKSFLQQLKKTDHSGSEKQILILELVLYLIELKSSKNKHQAYNKLRNILFENKNIIDSKLFLFYMSRLNEFCIFERLGGNNYYDRSLFENYKFILENNYYRSNSVIKMIFIEYRTILFTALFNRDIKWAENFIIEYGPYFDNNPELDIMNYSNAHILFYKNKFENSLKLISTIHPNSFVISIDIYILKSKLFYELNYQDSAYSNSNAFRQYVNNNSFESHIILNSTLNYIRFYNKLLSLKKSENNSRINDLINEIKSCKILRSKGWLLKKAEELLNY